MQYIVENHTRYLGGIIAIGVDLRLLQPQLPQVHTARRHQVYGREAAIAGTVATLAKLPGSPVYTLMRSSGLVTTRPIFYTSHRITHVGRNTGYSSFGPPTGRQVRYNAIADCVVRENRIVEEWLVRDNVTQIRQLGFNPLVLAERDGRARSGSGDQLPGNSR